MAAPVNARTTDRERSYIWPPTGEKFTSVTTVQKAMAKEALVYWSARVVAEGAVAKVAQWQAIRAKEGDEAAVRFLKGLPWEKRDRSADAGSSVHAAIAAEITGIEAPHWPTSVAGQHEQYERFKAAYQPEWIVSETTVYSRRYGVAGTLDFIARIGGRVLLGDVKTGENVYEESSLQLAAYRFAEWMDLGDGIEHPLPAIDGCAVLHIRPKSYRLIEVEAGQATYQSFLHLVQVHAWMQAAKASSPIGEMVMPVNLVPPATPSLDELLAGVA